MPFVAECAYCLHRVKVPDRALGSSVKCPKCASHYTLTPSTPPLPGRQEPRPPAPLAPPSDTSPAAAVATAEAPASAPQDARPAAPATTPPPEPGRPWIDPAGVVAVLLTTAALGSAAVFALAWLVIPLAAMALVAGLVGVGRAVAREKALWPAGVGAAVGGLVLVAAALFPVLLGPTYQSYRAKSAPDKNAVRVIPYAGREQHPDDTPEGVDAVRAALRQGNLQVGIAAVTLLTIEPPPRTGPAPRPPAASEVKRYLVVRLRVEKVAGGEEFAADRWLQPQSQAQPGLSVTDNTGRVYRSVPAGLEVDPGGRGHQSPIFPVAASDPVFAFEVPPPTVEFLRVEVPTATWGGSATFRFTVPRAMIRTETRQGK
jgi:hypothetical protein